MHILELTKPVENKCKLKTYIQNMLTKNLKYNLLFWGPPNIGAPCSCANSGSLKWRGEYTRTLKVS